MVCPIFTQTTRVVSESLQPTTDNQQPTTVSYSYHTNTFELASVSFGSYTTYYHWAAGRLTNVTFAGIGVNSRFDYSYKPNSDLLQKTVYLNGTVTVTRKTGVSP